MDSKRKDLEPSNNVKLIEFHVEPGNGSKSLKNEDKETHLKDQTLEKKPVFAILDS